MYIDAFRMVLIGAVLIVLLIFFGSPDKNKGLRVKTKEEKWIEAIQTQSNTKVKPYGVVGGGTANGTLGSGPGGANKNPPAYLPPAPSGAAQGTPAFQYPATAPGASAQQGTLPYQPSNPQNPPAYVPPSPTPGGAMGQPNAASPNPNDGTYFPQSFPRWNNGKPGGNAATPPDAPRSNVDPRFFLRSGQQVFLSGASVYVYDEDGKQVPLPDGDYLDKDSRQKLIVRGGKRIIN